MRPLQHQTAGAAPIIAAAVTKGEGFVALCAGLMAMCAAGAVAFWVLAFRGGKG